ncbi:MAG TPA: type 1 glutamine amidotransferase [Desulfuromonadales bacterium]|nr:type 1 glutamine amidotransferase [Desulfuromonadales bacterium]
MLHIIQNDPEVPPGNLPEHLTIPYTVHHPYRGDILPEIGTITALIVMGGAMGANDDARFPFLTELKTLIRSVVAARIPYLGVCLGGQLLAAALGAEVVYQRWEELGTLDVSLTQEGRKDRLFEGISEEFKSFQWHHDSFDIPVGGLLLASSAACPHQAFRIGEAAWGVQFHPEVTEPIIRGWCAWNRSTAEKADTLAGDFSNSAEEYRANSCRLVTNFVQQFPSFIQPCPP